MMKKRALALLVILCLLAPCALSEMQGSPMNLRINQFLARSLEGMPDKARNRTDTIVLGVPDLTGVFNPLYAQTQGDSYACGLLFDELIFFDEFGQWGDGMAKVSVSADGLVYTFTLAEAFFTDGVPVTSADFINTIYLLSMPSYDGSRSLGRLRILGMDAYLSGEAPVIAGLSEQGPKAFAVTLEQPNPSAPAYLALPALRVSHYGSMIRPETIENNEDARGAFDAEAIQNLRELDSKPAGYGQYDLTQLTEGEEALFTANEDYWRARPSTPRITLSVVPMGMEVLAITNGDVDIVSCYSSVDVVDAIYEAGYINLYSWMGDVFGYIGVQRDNPLFADERVRKAFAHAIRRKDWVLQETLERYADVPGMILFDSFAPQSDVLGELYPYDMDKAEALLDQAGWIKGGDGVRAKDGQRFAFTFYATQDSPVAPVLVDELKHCCEALGLELSVKMLPFLELVQAVEENGCDMYLQARRIPQSPALAAELFAGESHLNQSQYDSEGVERFMQWAALEAEGSRQSMVYEGLYQQLYLELPYIPLYRRCEMLLANARVRNMYVSSGHDVLADAYRLIIRDSLTDD